MILTSKGKNEVSRQTDTVCLDAAFLTPANAFAKALSCRLQEKYCTESTRFRLEESRIALTFACCNTRMLETELCTLHFSIVFAPKMRNSRSKD
jgi:hypothetical protein